MVSIRDSLVWDALISYCLVQSILFTLLFIFKKGGNRFTNLILASLSAGVSLILLEEFIGITVGYERYPAAIFLAGPIWYLLGPLIYVYIRFYTHSRRLSASDLLHIIPFLYVLFDTLSFHLLPKEAKISYYQSFIAGTHIDVSHNTNYIIFLIQSMIYTAMGMHRIYHRSNKLDNYRWLRSLTAGLLVITGLSLLMVLSVNYGYPMILINSDLYMLLMALFVLLLFYHSYRNPRVLFARSNGLLSEKSNWENEMQRINRFMMEEKPFRDPTFEINDLSKFIGLSKYKINYIIRGSTSLSFREYVNQYRINEAKRQLQKSENKIFTIESIAESAGFNSHATFYRIFRKLEGKTPKAFIQER